MENSAAVEQELDFRSGQMWKLFIFGEPWRKSWRRSRFRALKHVDWDSVHHKAVAISNDRRVSAIQTVENGNLLSVMLVKSSWKRS